MKLIIDIPEIFYQNEKENTGYVSELKRNIVWDAMINGTPLVEQEPILDKIRAEIAEYKDDKVIHYERNEMIDIVLEIIDKYRNEVTHKISKDDLETCPYDETDIL